MSAPNNNNKNTTTNHGLPARYQIRPLGPEHAAWAAAIVCHSNVFHSTVFSLVYPDDQPARFRQAMQAAGYLVDHQIQSGLSFGVFDTEYPFKQVASAACPAGGQFYWDAEGEDVLTGEDLLAAMDFPLVSVALAYDGVDKLDFAQWVLCFQWICFRPLSPPSPSISQTTFFEHLLFLFSNNMYT